MSVQIYKGDILLSEPEVATTQWEKARGLMFRKQHDVLFHFNEEKKLKFHMVFVFYPIDIVFLDHELRVVDLKPRFKPFTFYYSKACSSTVLETYAGFIRDRSIKVGDTFSIVHSGEIDRPSDQAPIPPAERKGVFQGTSLGRTREARVEQVSKSTDPATKPKSAKPKTTKRAPKKSTSKATKTSKASKTAKPKAAKTSPKTAKTPKKPAAKTTKKSAKPRSKAPAKRAAASSKTKKTAAKSSKSTKRAPKSAKPKAAKSAAKKPAKSSAKPKKSAKK